MGMYHGYVAPGKVLHVYVALCMGMHGYVGSLYVARYIYYWHVVHLKWTAVIFLKGRSHSCK